VPALPTRTCPSSPARRRCSAKIFSAIGDRQMFPVQTKTTDRLCLWATSPVCLAIWLLPLSAQLLDYLGPQEPMPATGCGHCWFEHAAGHPPRDSPRCDAETACDVAGSDQRLVGHSRGRYGSDWAEWVP
jgi:hypothetical protein